MLRVFEIHNEIPREVFPTDNVYNVQELGLYEIEYSPETITDLHITLEGNPLPSEYVRLEKNKILLTRNRYFEDYFGGATLSINQQQYAFNVRIGKLKRTEIEDLFAYIWRKEDRFFDVFYSKNSTIELKGKPTEEGQISKFLAFVQRLVEVLAKLLPYFEAQPHFVLRKTNVVLPFNPNKVTANTLQWIVNNLDEIQFDPSFKGHYKALELNRRYGIIDHINTEVETKNFNTYENQVLMGAFFVILKKIKDLKRDIEMKLSLKTADDTDERYVDFRDLKRLPFIHLFEEATAVELKVKKIEQNYKRIFSGVVPKIEKPVLTSIFIQRAHYKRAYELIRKLSEYKFDMVGYFKLFNISKLSKLYELYNLFQLIDILKTSLKLPLFSVTTVQKKDEPIVEKMQFVNDTFVITLYYEHKYYPEGTGYTTTLLRRIDKTEGDEYYHPDFIIEIQNKVSQSTYYYLFDAKYSVLRNVKQLHLPSLEKKYIVRTGISGKRNRKINGLFALLPDTQGEIIIDSPFFEPIISMLASKPHYDTELKNCVQTLLKKHLNPRYLMVND